MPFTPMSPTQIIISLLGRILYFYELIVIAAVVMSWLLNFNVVNYHNNFVRAVMRILDALTEPAFRLARRILPPISGLDLSPILILGAIWLLQVFVLPLLGNLIFPLLG